MKKLVILAITLCAISCGKKNNTQKEDEMAPTPIVENEMSTRAIDQVEDVPADPDLSDRFEGVYECSRTGDIYIFEADNTGKMIASGYGTPATFDWSRKGSNVTLVYTGESEAYGSQKLQYEEKEHYILEESMSFGTLIFRKK